MQHPNTPLPWTSQEKGEGGEGILSGPEVLLGVAKKFNRQDSINNNCCYWEEYDTYSSSRAQQVSHFRNIERV